MKPDESTMRDHIADLMERRNATRDAARQLRQDLMVLQLHLGNAREHLQTVLFRLAQLENGL